MTQLSKPSANIDAAAGDLVLRIRGTNRDGQTVGLRSSKCTVGSSPTCTLRIVARGVRPVHCLILRGKSATVVRRWCSDVRLNGRGFVDERLTPGDVLTIGPVGLEILECPAPVEQPAGDMAGASFGAAAWEPDTRSGGLEHPAQEADDRGGQLATQMTREKRRERPDAADGSRDDGSEEPEPDGSGKGEDAAKRSSAGMPLATVELLRRLGVATHLGGEVEQREASSLRAGCPEPGETASPRPHADDEESIDDYMSKLLARVRSAASSLGPKPPPSEGENKSSAATGAEGTSSQQEAAATSPDDSGPQAGRRRRVSPVQTPPRAVVPERLADLSAMRELANLSAQAAISHHTRRTLVSRRAGKLIVAITALACSGWLLGTWWYGKGSSVALYGGSLGLAAALLWTIQYAIVTGRILVNRAGHLQWVSAAGRKTDEEPAEPRDETPEVSDGAPEVQQPAAEIADEVSEASVAPGMPGSDPATPESPAGV